MGKAKTKQNLQNHSARTGSKIFVKILITFLSLTVAMVLFSSLLISSAFEEVISRNIRNNNGGIQTADVSADQDLFLTEQNVQIQIGLLVFLTIILTAFFTVIISGSLTRPIKKLVQGTREIAAGHLNFKLRLKAPREIMELADSFNIMSGDLKASLASLELERDKTKAIIHYLTDGLIVINSRETVSIINPRAKEMLGLKNENWRIKIGPHLFMAEELFYRNLARAIYGAKKSSRHKILSRTTKSRVINLEDNKLALKITATPLYDSQGRVSGSMRIMRDISREQRIDQLKSEFITIAAHQLRTPLSAVKWALRLLQEDKRAMDNEQSDLIDKAFLSNERMIRLVNDLLDVSLIEEGKYAFVFMPSKFGDVIDAIGDIFKERIKNKKITLIKQIPKEMPLVKMDKDKIIMVLENIMDNAVKYTPENGQINLAVEILANNIRVTVADNGVGIPENHLDRLYSKFFRAENVMRMQTEGSGLGLFVVKKIIEEHKGRIKMVSKEGHGTTVEFVLPIK